MGIRDIFSRKEKLDFEQHIRTDEHGCKWVDTEFFGFGDLSPAKDDTGLAFPTAEEFLRLHGHEYPWRDMWLERGEAMTPPSRQTCVNISKAGGHMRGGDCYNSSLRLVLGMENKIILPRKPNEILYGEGIAVHPTGAHLHAWLVIDGTVYDPTWPDAHRATYFGIAFDPQWRLGFAERFNQVSLLQNWHYAYPELTSLFGAQN